MKNWEEGADAMLFFFYSISIHTINAFCLTTYTTWVRGEEKLSSGSLKYHKRFKFSSSHHIEYNMRWLEENFARFPRCHLWNFNIYFFSLMFCNNTILLFFITSLSLLTHFLNVRVVDQQRRMKRGKTQEFFTEINLRIGLKNVKFLL